MLFGSVADFFEAKKDTVFRFWVYKKMFTPYELDKKFTDESVFTDDTANLGKVVSVTVLPDQDILLGFLTMTGKDDEGQYVEYHRLSDIELAECTNDKEEELCTL